MMRIAVYGSLRAGLQNFDYFMSEAKFVGTERIKGFDMYSLGSYPCISKGRGSVVFEVYDVDDDTAIRIAQMERGAGYEIDTTETTWGEAIIFIYPDRLLNQYRISNLVLHGDWKEYYNNRLLEAL